MKKTYTFLALCLLSVIATVSQAAPAPAEAPPSSERAKYSIDLTSWKWQTVGKYTFYWMKAVKTGSGLEVTGRAMPKKWLNPGYSGAGGFELSIGDETKHIVTFGGRFRALFEHATVEQARSASIRWTNDLGPLYL